MKGGKLLIVRKEIVRYVSSGEIGSEGRGRYDKKAVDRVRDPALPFHRVDIGKCPAGLHGITVAASGA